MYKQQKPDYHKYISLIDIDNQNEENLYKTTEETTVQDLIRNLQQTYGDQYSYLFIIRSQFYNGNIKEKVWNLIEDITQQKLSILFKKQQQLEKEQPNEVKKYSAYFQSQNSKQKSQSQTKNYTSGIYNKNFAIIQQQKQNYVNQDPQNNNQAIIQQQKQLSKTNPNNNLQYDNDIQQQVQAQRKAFRSDIKQIIDTCYKEQFQEINKKLENFEQYNDRIKDLQNQIDIQKQENEQLNKTIEELQKMNINQKFLNVEKQFENIAKGFKYLKQEMDSQIIQLSNQIQNISRQFNEKQNDNSLIQSQIYFEYGSILSTPSTKKIQLKCTHQIDRQKFEEIVQNAINKGTVPQCEFCQIKPSTQNFKELGYLGDQYLQIQIEKNLSSLKQNIVKKIGYQQVMICNNNCKFFCIFQTYQHKQKFYYCPICLQNSVQYHFENNLSQTKKK